MPRARPLHTAPGRTFPMFQQSVNVTKVPALQLAHQNHDLNGFGPNVASRVLWTVPRYDQRQTTANTL